MNCAEITLIVSSVITTKINRHPSDLQQLFDQIAVGFVMIVIKFVMITSFMQILISFAICGEIPGEMDRRRPSVAIWRKFGLKFDFSHQILNNLSFYLDYSLSEGDQPSCPPPWDSGPRKAPP